MKHLLQYIFLLLLGLSAFSGAQAQQSISFQHMMGNQTLVLDDSLQNSNGEKLVVRRFKYYISNLVLIDEQGNKQAIPDTYYLVNEAEPNSKKIILPNANKNYSAIEFLLGVDSARNCSGIQTGVLDPIQGMFWTWNTGYVFAKLEGAAPSSVLPAHAFTYHIGGFRTGENVLKTIRLAIPGKALPKDLQVKVDINTWFSGTNTLLIADRPVCHSPGALAMKFAANYAQMFSIIQP
jgi:hypothetical protein